MNRCVVGVLIGWACSAQTIMSPEQIQAALLRDMRGDTDFDYPLPDNPHNLIGPFEIRDPWSHERPSGESISIKQLRHKVPKEASRAAVRAEKWSRAGDHSKAAFELEAAIRWDPEFVAAYNALGVEYERCGRLGEAAAVFSQVIQLAPEAWVGHYNLGVAMFQSGDLPGSVQSERRALQLSPGQPTVNLFLGYLLTLRRETQTEAVAYLQYAARWRPEAKQILRLLESARGVLLTRGSISTILGKVSPAWSVCLSNRLGFGSHSRYSSCSRSGAGA